MKKLSVYSIVVLLSLSTFSCSALKDFSRTMTNLSHTKFKLDSVNGFQLAGVPLENKSNLGIMDGA